jgi:hypothetical protein
MDLQKAHAITDQERERDEAAELLAAERRKKSIAFQEQSERKRRQRELDEAHSFLAGIETAYDAVKGFSQDTLVRCGAKRAAPADDRDENHATALPASVALPVMLERALRAARRRLATLEGDHVPTFPSAEVGIDQ